MQRYRIASWILLSLFIINFTLAAPVAVRDEANDRIAILQKRMDTDKGQLNDQMSEHEAPNSVSDLDLDLDAGSGSESGWDAGSELNSGSESESESDDSDGGETAKQWEEEPHNHEPWDMEGDQEYLDFESSEEDDYGQSSPHNPEHADDILQGPESQNPAASESVYEDLGSKLLKDSLKPRTSTSGAVDAAERELQETDDTRAEFLDVPAISDSSVIGHGGTASQYSSHSHSQNLKR